MRPWLTRSILAVLLMATGLGVAGCRQLAGYSAAGDTGQDLDAGRDRGPLADQRLEGPTDVDPPPSDTRLDVASKDTGLPELGPTADLLKADKGPPPVDLTSSNDAGCSEVHVVHPFANVVPTPSCSGQRDKCITGLGLDKDCDGMPDSLDPSGGCNKLLFADEGHNNWGIASSNGCTVLIDKGITASPSPGSAAVNSRIWLVRFYTPMLLPTVGTGNKVVFSGQNGSLYRACAIEPGSLEGSIRLHLTVDQGQPWSIKSAKEITPPLGGDYELMMTSLGTAHECALFDASGAPLLTATGVGKQAISSNQTIKMNASGSAQIEVDYVRVYELIP